MKNFATLGIFLFAILFATNLTFAATISTPQISAFNSIITPSSSFNSSMCQQGQDFIVQVSPSGCTPAVVRSDLLSQQDVPVFCPLVATQTNPLINVNSITGISFTGNYSKYVSTIGFYPAQAALNLQGQQTQNNYPVLSNIGYAVIDLKQMPNESSMPDFVSGNLTAKLSYNAQNIFGVGNTNFYLPQISDSDWQTQYGQYGFWNNKGFLRATNIQGNSATIQIYDGNLNPTSTLTLQSGQSSSALSISGFDLCTATMQVKLNGLQNADTMAKLNINGNVISASKGQTFLNNQCQITNLIVQGLTQDAQMSCNTDSGKKTFDLRISPTITLTVTPSNGKTTTQDYTLGQKLFDTKDGTRSVYLGYIGTIGNDGWTVGNFPLTQDFSNLDIVLVAWPKSLAQQEDTLTNAELSSVASWVQGQSTQWKAGTNTFTNVVTNILKVTVGIFDTALREVIQGQKFTIITKGSSVYNSNIDTTAKDDSADFYDAAHNEVSIVGFSQGQDAILNTQVNQYYQNATSDYQTVLNSYPGETYPLNNQATLGEQSLNGQMSLANSLGEKNTLAGLCTTFIQRYPKSAVPSFCSDATSLSSQSSANNYISINGQSYLISLNSIYQPSYNDFGAQVNVRSADGSTNTFFLLKDQPVFINQTSNDFIQLSALNNGGVVGGNGTATIISNTQTLTLREGTPAGLGNNYVLTLMNINLKQFAQVSLTPNVNNAGSSVNFSFNIGIEKRAIQLTPDQIKDKINSTNAEINKWESISNTTGKLVQTLSTVCQDAGLALFVKNFIDNLGGAGIARQSVMSGAGGWYNKCSTLISQGKYSSQDQCLTQNSQQIDADVTQMNKLINTQNTKIQQIEKNYTKSSILGGNVVNTDQFMQSYLPQITSSATCSSVPNSANLLTYPNYKNNFFGVTDARNVELYSNILKDSSSSDSLKNVAQQGLCSTLTNINVNSQKQQQIDALIKATGANSAYVISTDDKVRTIAITQSQTFKDLSSKTKYTLSSEDSIDSSSNVAVVQDSTKGVSYLLTYAANGVVSATYLIGLNNQLSTLASSNIPEQQTNQINPLNVKFNLITPGTYNNEFKNPQVQYFEMAPYQGMPAIVPFDLKNGWYAGVQQNVPSTSALGGSGTTTATQSYTAAGQVQSFYLCNIGANGIEEFNSGIGDDTCVGVNLGTNQLYNQFPGLDTTQAANLVNQASSAIQQAARARATNPSLTTVTINNQNIPVGQPATNSPKLQCTDFMSPSDCNILFNVCDPVICPSSRCNFGGAYPVQDVVQTGVIGSILLCLPNSVLLGGSDVIPVCLPGIQSGIDNWVSVQKAYRDCLQTNLDTGKTTGICDEMNSVYMCQFWWQQAQPLVNLAAPLVLSTIAGQNTHGGGEYMSVQNALQSAQQSANYITNYYATNSANAFKAQSTQNIGSALCQNFISVNLPGGADIANSLSAVDSPPQYTGTFQEIPFTTATVPPTSQYEVYYHIYAGKNSGVYYSVYLQRSSSSSFYQDTSSTRQIDSGYVAAGGYQDQTKDFTATSGYNKLCINVNGQINCGFQQVSTSLAINYLQSQYLSQEANNTQISSAGDCVSGTPNVYSMLNPNIQNGATNTLNPQIYNQGITRICATSNPGQGTDPNAGAQNSRWVQVGTCGNANLKCWLDTSSLKSVINSPDIATFLSNGSTQNLGSATLQSVESNYATILQSSGFLSNDQFVSSVNDIQSKSTPSDKISAIQDILTKVFYNNQKAYLYFLRGEAYKQLALQTTGTSALHLDNGIRCIADFDCSSNYCDPKTELCADRSTAATTPTGSTAPSNSANNAGNSANTQTTTPNSQASIPSSVSGITANDLLNAMINAQTNKIVNRNCNCGTSAQCLQYANSIISASNTYNEDPVLLLSIMMQESECTAGAQSGSSYGLMQISSYNLCSSLGVKGLSDITGSANYDKNIQCGASILQQKYTLFSQGATYTCGSFSASYSGWNAAIRGYIGYGCTGNANVDVTSYVSDVNSRYAALNSLIASNQISSPANTNTATNYASSTVNPTEITQFNTYKTIFDKYSQPIQTAYTTTSLSKSDFEALLIAIAQYCNWGGSSSDFLMCYPPNNYGDPNYKGADRQVATVAGILKSVLSEINSNPSSVYNTCLSTTVMNERLTCVLTVLHTQKSFSYGFLGLGIGGSNTDYANSVLSIWTDWKNYFNTH